MNGIVRVDDRLIHGQVVVGWGNFYHPKEIILINDEIAEDEMESEIYLLGVPIEYSGKVLSTSEGGSYLNSCNEKFIAVVKTPSDVIKLIDSGLSLDSLNLGGMHDKVGKEEYNHFIYLSEDDKRDIEILKSRGVEVYIQDLPSSKKVIY